MGRYIATRVVYMVAVTVAVSITAFVIIQLPPGDFLTTLVAKMSAEGTVDEALVAAMRARYGLDEPIHVQYWRWATGMLQGDFGWSFDWNKPVSELVWGRIGPTVVITVTTLFFMWIVAFPIGVYSAVRQYSAGDYVVPGRKALICLCLSELR